MDSPYYSKSELPGGVVMVSFSKYLPWQAMRFLRCSTHFSKICYRPFAANFRIMEQAVLTSCMVGKVQKLHGAIFGLYSGCSNGDDGCPH
jgi:hypothetical protein